MDFPEIYFPSGAKCLVRILPWQIDSESEVVEFIQKLLSENSVSQLFFYFPSDSEARKSFRFLIPYFQEKKIPYFPIDGRRVEGKEFLYYRKLSQFARKQSESGHVMILVPEHDASILITLLPVLFLRPLHVSPNFVIKQTLGRTELTKDDQTVCEYLHYLNPNYYMPTRFRKIIQSEKPTDSFWRTKYSIRLKLLSITTAILAISISGMIWLASMFFRETITVMIQDYNLNLSRLVGDVVESDVDNLVYRAELFGELVDRSSHPSPQSREVEDFFQKNPAVLYYANVSVKGNGIVVDSAYTNSAFARDFGMGLEDWKTTLMQSRYMNRKTNQDGVWIERFASLTKSANPSNPSTIEIDAQQATVNEKDQKNSGLFLFLNRTGTGYSRFRVVAISPSYFLKSLDSSRQGEFFEMHLVDSRGIPILTTNPALDVSSLPIVKKMLNTGLDNGSQRFHYLGEDYMGSFRIVSRFQIGVISSVKESKAFAAVYQIQKRNVHILIMILSLSFIFIFLFAKTLSIPIIRLVNATKKIESGDLDVEIEARTEDEIGLLTNSFKSMANGLREREKIKEEFGKFVNPEIAERALRGELSLGGERKECTVFFSDIRSFTALSESREPEKVVEILNEYFTEMVDCVHITGGVVDKFIGDAVMAHWGAILPEIGDAKKAVDSALLMRIALLDLNKRLEAKGIPPIRIGCGINSGPVIAGQIGSQKRLEFTVIGDAVNLASRIEYLNKEFCTDILISESTYLRVSDIYDCVPMEPIYVRGKVKPQLTYAVLGKFNDSTRPRDLGELRKLVGIPDPKNPSSTGVET